MDYNDCFRKMENYIGDNCSSLITGGVLIKVVHHAMTFAYRGMGDKTAVDTIGREKAIGGNDGRYEGSDVQPIDLIESMSLGFHEGNIVKYVCRYKKKGGLEDLRKAEQYLKWLIAKTEKGMEEEPND